MSAEANKAIVRRVFDEIWNGGNLALIDDLVAADYVNHSAADPAAARGPAGYRQTVSGARTAFPDWQETIEDMVAEGDRVVVRFTIRGRQQGQVTGPLGPIAPTGKAVTVPGLVIYRLVEGKLAERWGVNDTLGMLQQLGSLPTPAPVAG